MKRGTCELPLVAVDEVERDGILAAFFGEHAMDHATDFVATLPEHRDGRYGLSVSDVSCSRCDEMSSHEAWDGDRCPHCLRTATALGPDDVEA